MSQVFDVRITGLQMGAVLIAYKRHKVTELYTADTLDNEKVAWTVGVTILTLIVGESIARISGLMPPVKRGDYLKPSSLTSLGTLLNIASEISTEFLGFSKSVKISETDAVTSKVVEAATSQAPLNTGSKLRGAYLSKEPALAFATMMICCCIMFSGRSALSENSAFRVANLLLPQASKRCR